MTVGDPRLDPGRVRAQRETYPGFYWLELEFPGDYPAVLPGQYLNLKLSSALFRRPFGVVGFRRDGNASVVELYYGVIGEATQEMSDRRPGDLVDCLGPLGTSYAVDSSRPAILVAGGRGAAPLLYLYQLLKEAGHDVVRFAFGAASAGMLFGLDRLDEENLFVSTDDGSAGFRGTIIAALRTREEWLADDGVLYTCGPEKFLAATAGLAAEYGLGCQVSLEGVYACGLGLCRGCAVPLKNEERFMMQCCEGPVMDATLVDWERMKEL